MKIEAFGGYRGVPDVQASRINNAKLQMIILSPGFLSFLNSEPELLLGKFLRPNRVLALLVGVSKETIKADTLAFCSLYTFDEWPCLAVRDRDTKFVNHLQEESLKLLNRCDLFDEFKTSSAFNICPRKITQSYCKVYIHLRSPLMESGENKVGISVEKPPTTTCPISTIQYHNPFTLSFDMPEKLLGVSSFLKVNLFIKDKFIGYRELKCEAPIEVLRDVLKTAVDPIMLMCQALDISPASNDLDEYLSQKLRSKLPKLKCMWNKITDVSDYHYSDKDLPTWLHFSAFYGLQNFTWELLGLQNFERALVIKNNKGHTPAILALKAGYTKLAQDLENVSIVMSLAQNYASINAENEESVHNSRFDNCSAPIQTPRSHLSTKSRKEIASYDTPPQPRPLSETSFRGTPPPPRENFSSTPKSDVTIYTNLMRSPSLQLSEEECIKNSVKTEKTEQYLDMSGSYSLLENYKNDIFTLVSAWDKKNDVQTFLNEYEQTISKIKENLHFHSSREKAISPISSSISEDHEENSGDIESSSSMQQS